MSVAESIALISAIITGAYGLLVPKVNEEREYYKTLCEENKIKKTYFSILKRILDFVTDHFGRPFSRQSFNLSTNLAVFYSFAAFFLIYVVTGHGSFGNLEILSGDINKGTRFIILLVSVLYFLYLYSSYKDLRAEHPTQIPAFKKAILIILSFLPSAISSLTISLEWNGIHTTSLFIKTITILALSVTLSAAILGFGGYGKGARSGNGAYVFNATYLSIVGLAAVFSTLAQVQQHGMRTFVVLVAFLILCAISYTFFKRKIDVYLLNVFLVALSIYVINKVPGVYGMDIISSSLVYFFVALPFINGLLDHTSISISRLFANRIMRKGRVSTLITHVIIDLLIAAILLFLLIYIFIFITQLFNLAIAGSSTYSIPLTYIFNTAINNPLSPNGIWFYSMMFSTLVPTFGHLAIVVSSLIFHHPFEYLRRLMTRTVNKPELVTEDRVLIVSYVSVARFGSIAAILVVLVWLVEKLGPLYMLWIEDLIPFGLLSI